MENPAFKSGPLYLASQGLLFGGAFEFEI